VVQVQPTAHLLKRAVCLCQGGDTGRAAEGELGHVHVYLSVTGGDGLLENLLNPRHRCDVQLSGQQHRHPSAVIRGQRRRQRRAFVPRGPLTPSIGSTATLPVGPGADCSAGTAI
jgi:hypothetical protein